MANNAIPDSIITNITWRNLVPPVESRARSTEVGLETLVTLSILNTIMPVAKVFTAMDSDKLAVNNVSGIPGTASASHVARGNELVLAYQTKID